MKKLIVILNLILFFSLNVQSQCKNENIAGVYLIGEQITQCEPVKFGLSISEGMIGQTNRGNFEVRHEENLTIVELCYFKDDEPHFAMPSVSNDEIEIYFTKSGLRKAEFRIKNTLTTNEKDCESCSEYFSYTISLDVLPKNQYSFSPNPTEGFIKVETESNDNFSDKEINLYSISGQFVKKVIVNSDNNLIDLSGFSAGVYILKVGQDECERKVFKIVKI